MTSINLYLVESPFQILSGLESMLSANAASEGEEVVSYMVVRKTRSERNNAQMELLVERKFVGVIDKSYFIDYGGSRGGSHFNVYRSFCKLSFLKDKISAVYIGDFRSDWMHGFAGFLRAKVKWLLDDGNATLKFQRDFIARGNFITNKNGVYGKIERLLYLPFIRRSIECPNLYTAFDINPIGRQKVHKHSFQLLRTALDRKERGERDQIIYFGGKLSEEGIVSEEYEMMFLNVIFNTLKDQYSEVMYFSHRGESSAKKKKVRSIGFQIVESDLPAEMYILTLDYLPRAIGAAFSTVLSTIPLLSNLGQVWSFRISSDELCREHKFAIEECYSYLERSGVRITSC